MSEENKVKNVHKIRMTDNRYIWDKKDKYGILDSKENIKVKIKVSDYKLF